MSLKEAFHTLAEVSFIASVVANLLPKAEVFNNYPRVKRFYETLVDVISATAANLRHCLPSLDLPMMGFRKPDCSDDSKLETRGNLRGDYSKE